MRVVLVLVAVVGAGCSELGPPETFPAVVATHSFEATPGASADARVASRYSLLSDVDECRSSLAEPEYEAGVLVWETVPPLPVVALIHLYDPADYPTLDDDRGDGPNGDSLRLEELVDDDGHYTLRGSYDREAVFATFTVTKESVLVDGVELGDRPITLERTYAVDQGTVTETIALRLVEEHPVRLTLKDCPGSG